MIVRDAQRSNTRATCVCLSACLPACQPACLPVGVFDDVDGGRGVGHPLDRPLVSMLLSAGTAMLARMSADKG
jgi:hypothetical protein